MHGNEILMGTLPTELGNLSMLGKNYGIELTSHYFSYANIYANTITEHLVVSDTNIEGILPTELGLLSDLGKSNARNRWNNSASFTQLVSFVFKNSLTFLQVALKGWFLRPYSL
jgi:hypothetical protein